MIWGYSYDLGNPHIFPWYVHYIPLRCHKNPIESHQNPMTFHLNTIDIPWIPSGYISYIPLIFPWYSHCIPLTFQYFKTLKETQKSYTIPIIPITCHLTNS
jgi:hypothetical protein